MDKVINQDYIDILGKMVEIRQYIRSESIENREVSLEQATEKYKDFAKSNKALFEQCAGKEMDFNKTVYMFRLKTLVDDGKITDYDASVVHGKMMYDTYMKKD